jgi:hypothetical protein
MSAVSVSFLAKNEDKPTHDVVLVDEAPFFGCVIDCSSLSLLLFNLCFLIRSSQKHLHVLKRKLPILVLRHMFYNLLKEKDKKQNSYVLLFEAGMNSELDSSQMDVHLMFCNAFSV